MQLTVTKPAPYTGVFTNTLTITANSTGGGVGAIPFPTYSLQPWTAVTPPLDTFAPGQYSVSVDETSPRSVAGVASTNFRVTTQLKVGISSPNPNTNIIRGTSVTITANVNDVNGNPMSLATVTASTPRGSIPLTSTGAPGSYTNSYLVQESDPQGSWNVNVTATTSPNNIGSWVDPVSILPSQLIITSLSTYNAFGTPTADFSPGETMYVSFRVGYSGAGYLTAGSFSIQVRNPAGGTATTLQTLYDTTRGLFYTPSGFQVSSSDPEGSWELLFPAFGMNDTYGNSGPSTAITYRFTVHQNQSIISPFYFVLAALAIGGGLGTTVFLRRFNSTTGPFDDLFKLTGGEMQRPATLMIMGDPGAGSSTLALQLLYRDLKSGVFGGLLSYDSFPSEITRKMRDMGWDITPYLEAGKMKILDCYSALAGVEGSLIRDPTDFTEVSIQVTGMIEKAKGPTTILFDSVTPIFNSASAKDCINFLQVLGAKVKNNGGTFIFTATKGSIPEDARTKIESLADGVIELNLTKKAKSLVRSLVVKKLSGRQTSSRETEFEIAQGKGILIRRQRIHVGLFRP